MLSAAGVRRIRVQAWLPDAPYPVADVEDWPDEDASLATEDRVNEVANRARRVRALASELHEGGGPLEIEIADDPLLASYHLCALAPVGPDDRLPAPRLRRAGRPPRPPRRALAETEMVLQLRLGSGQG